MKKIIKYIANPFLLALILFFIVYFFLPSIFSKYRAPLVRQDYIALDRYSYYNDLDFDAHSEIISLFDHKSTDFPLLHIARFDHAHSNEWILSDPWVRSSDLLFGDWDNDSIKEIFVFTQSEDSVFINVYNHTIPEGLVYRKFISTVTKHNGIYTYEIDNGKIIDMDGDSYKEAVFVFNAGYSLSPRGVYAVDLHNDTIYSTPTSGANIISLNYFDIDNDNLPEICASTYASRNIKDEFPYSDSTSWIMVFDNDLSFLFEPIKAYGYTSGTNVLPIRKTEKQYLAALLNQGTSKNSDIELILLNIRGKKLAKRILTNNHRLRLYCKDLEVEDDLRLLLFNENGSIRIVNDQLKTTRKHRLGLRSGSSINTLDLDGDKIDEIIIGNKNNNEFYIYRHNFKHPVKINTPNELGKFVINSATDGINQNYLYIQQGENHFLFKYEKNPLYWYKYLTFAGIYLVFLLLVFFIRNVQKASIEKQYQDERRLAEFQFRAIKNQVDPHFTLNMLNAIGSLFHKGQEQADYYFGKYAKLVRTTLMSSDKIAITLEEEIDFVENYLILERFRFSNRFDYEINYLNEVDTKAKIPRMIIHTFIENAVKHGLKHKKAGGKLSIDIEKTAKGLAITIEDNGVGRNYNRNSIESTGKGLEIVDQIIELYNSLNKTKIRYRVIDLFDNFENATGTRVEVLII